MPMGKTETIKKRRVDVYLPSELQKERWNKYARKMRTPLSKLIISVMETHMGEGLPDTVNERLTLKSENEALLKENEVIRTEKIRLEKFVELLEREMNRSQSISMMDNGQGFRKYNRKLVDLLQNSSIPIPHNEILRELHINPIDTDVVQGISKQLESLSEFGLIKYTVKGWKWNEK